MTETTAALYPPRIEPPEVFRGGLRGFVELIRNPVATLPAPIYRDPAIALRRWGRDTLWLADPELIGITLQDKAGVFHKSPVEKRIFRPILGNGIMTAEDQDWRWQRHAVAPLFRHANLLEAVPAIGRIAAATIDNWRSLPPAESHIVDDDMGDATFTVLTETLLTGITAEETAALRREIDAYLARSTWEAAYGMIGLPENFWHPARRRMMQAKDRRRRIVDKLIERRFKDGLSGEDTLARLARAQDPESGRQMDRELLNDNLQTFFGAGHETSARTLAWTLFLLARAPDWQDRLREEVLAVAGDEPIEADQIGKLLLTQQVLKEAMRLYPAAPMLTRVTTHAVTLGTHELAANTIVIIPIYAVHRHKLYWRDPDRFDPQRFDAKAEAAIPRFSYLPFGGGKRSCLGGAFAMIEMTTLLANFIRSAKFDWPGGTQPMPLHRVHLRPDCGVSLRISVPR